VLQRRKSAAKKSKTGTSPVQLSMLLTVTCNSLMLLFREELCRRRHGISAHSQSRQNSVRCVSAASGPEPVAVKFRSRASRRHFRGARLQHRNLRVAANNQPGSSFDVQLFASHSIFHNAFGLDLAAGLYLDGCIPFTHQSSPVLGMPVFCRSARRIAD
jgi:hypothetical protein